MSTMMLCNKPVVCNGIKIHMCSVHWSVGHPTWFCPMPCNGTQASRAEDRRTQRDKRKHRLFFTYLPLTAISVHISLAAAGGEKVCLFPR